MKGVEKQALEGVHIVALTSTGDNISYKPLRNNSERLFQKGIGFRFAASVGDGRVDFGFGSSISR